MTYNASIAALAELRPVADLFSFTGESYAAMPANRRHHRCACQVPRAA